MAHFFRTILLILGFLATSSTLLSAHNQCKYSYFPKNIYPNQLFPVTVIIMDANNSEKPDFNFDANSNVQPIDKKPLVIQNGSENFYTFYFKAQKSDIRIPELVITSQLRHTVLPSSVIPIKELEIQKDYSGVLATEMIIKNSQVSNYDEDHYIVTLHLEANEANLEDMRLANLKESGIEDIQRENAKVYGNFYAIVPTSQKFLTFSYYNTIKNQYNSFKVPIEIKDDPNATNTDLNPQDDNFEEIKKFFLFTFAGFFLLMFLLKRDFFFLTLGVVSFITLLTLYVGHQKICIKQGAPFYILPTHISAISSYNEKEFNADVLGKRDIYFKIETKQGMIGWVKNEDLCQN